MMSPSVWPIKYLNRPWNRVSITSLHIYYLGILRGGEKIFIINHQQDLLNIRTHTLVIYVMRMQNNPKDPFFTATIE